MTFFRSSMQPGKSCKLIYSQLVQLLLCLCINVACILTPVSASSNIKFIDLSYSLSNETVSWPGRSTSFYTESEGITAEGFWYASRGFCTSEHSTTHIDAPYHFNENGRKLHQIPFEDLVDVPGVLIDVYDKVHRWHNGKLGTLKNYATTREDVLEWESKHGRVPQGAVVLVRTGWEQRWGNPSDYLGIKGNATSSNEAYNVNNLNFPGVDVSAAIFLATERQVRGVGVDTISIDPGNSRTYETHRYLASRNIYMLEMVANLHLLPPRDFSLLLLPLKIDAGTAAPCRILARCAHHNDTVDSRNIHTDNPHHDEE